MREIDRYGNGKRKGRKKDSEEKPQGQENTRCVMGRARPALVSSTVTYPATRKRDVKAAQEVHSVRRHGDI